jgi:hypothetical protein
MKQSGNKIKKLIDRKKVSQSSISKLEYSVKQEHVDFACKKENIDFLTLHVNRAGKKM